ncbi:hypothetical protein DY000_02062382 [Brassica cretica]|uniref:Secreted protein n=1 Tax=Brassica cretica TaxID=69181 RepID=A0ABQ7AY59_BRACR|nr:hypothetical protein DY000_02062382 [Brassica cretica]
MVFRPSRVLSCVMFCLDEIVSLSLSRNLSAVDRIFSGSSPSVDHAGDLGLLGVLPLSILLAEEPFGLLSFDSPGPSVVSSPARLPRWLSSALSLFLAVYLSRFLSYGSPFGLLSLSIPLVGGSGHLRDASLRGSHWQPIRRRRSI